MSDSRRATIRAFSISGAARGGVGCISQAITNQDEAPEGRRPRLSSQELRPEDGPRVPVSALSTKEPRRETTLSNQPAIGSVAGSALRSLRRAGSHGTLYPGDRKTTVKNPWTAVGKGQLGKMLARIETYRDES